MAPLLVKPSIFLVSILSTSWEMLQRQISVVISLPMIVQLGKTLLLLKRSADYALGVVYHVKQQHFNPHPTTRPGATSWMILYPLIPLCFNPHPTTRPGATACARRLTAPLQGFNPHPTTRPGATLGINLNVRTVSIV